jgi:predicted DNA-binding transcriptional regulator AlpA
MHDISDPILSEEDLAKWLETSRPTLQRQRSQGNGPPFVQLSERRIGYRKSAVERWLETRTINQVGALSSTTKGAEPALTVTVNIDAKTAPQVQPAPSGSAGEPAS